NGSRRRARGQIDDPELLADLDRIVSDDKRRLREYVLHPRPVGNLKGRPPDVVPAKWDKPMGPATMHHWFKRCIGRTPGLPDLTMDGLRLAATQAAVKLAR